MEFDDIEKPKTWTQVDPHAFYLVIKKMQINKNKILSECIILNLLTIS